MSSDRYGPPKSGPTGSGSASIGSSSHDGVNEGLVETGIDAPQYEWVYNSDHTDPVNFGYMFLKPVGTRPTLASGSTSIPIHPPSTTRSRNQTETSPPVTVSPTAESFHRQSSHSLSPDSAGSSSSSPSARHGYHKQSQPSGKPLQTSSGSYSQGTVNRSAQDISFQTSQSHSNISLEQLTTQSLQWLAK